MLDASAMTGVRLLWLASGSYNVQIQALYSIYSALAFRGASDVALNVYTDSPEIYCPLADSISIHQLAPARAKSMRGPAGLPYRMKLALLLEVLPCDPSSAVIFVDADTFFFREFEPLLQEIDERNAVMHIREWHVDSAATGQLRRFRRNMQRMRFHGESLGLDIYMWNSGVIGIDPSAAPVLQQALELCDEVWTKYSKPFVEQFAVSWSLQRAGIALHPAHEYIFHYWYQKPEYQRAVEERLRRWQGQPLASALQEVREQRVVLPTPARKLNWREKLEQRLSGRAIPDVRGLPRD